MKIPVHVNKNVKKQICSLVQKVNLIEQNQHQNYPKSAKKT